MQQIDFFQMLRRKAPNSISFKGFICLIILVSLVTVVIYLPEAQIFSKHAVTVIRGVEVKPFLRDVSPGILNHCVLVEKDYIRGKVNLRVIIITFNRPQALKRLLRSLDWAVYNGENVIVEVWIDRDKESGNFSKETLDVARSFTFTNALCEIRIHPKHVGIKGQWLTTWRAYDFLREILVILEDDLTVSKYFYKWLKLVHQKYGQWSNVSGFTLQGNSVRHSDGECCLNVKSTKKVFLYSTIGTSGFSPNNKNWKMFKTWLANLKKRQEGVPLVPNHVSSWWYQTGRNDSMWEMEYLYYTWKHKEFTIYPNFEGHRGLVFNWQEDGLHYQNSIKTERDENNSLVLDWNLTFNDLPDNPAIVLNNGSMSFG
ncbi:hypothetical protein ACF0H5_001936 [Mactra antiquata]